MASQRVVANVSREYLKRARQVLTSSFDYVLPENRIATRPLQDRSSSKLLVVPGSGHRLRDRQFTDLPALLPPGCLLVKNSSKVIPARIPMQKRSGGRAEVMLLSPTESKDPLEVLESTHWGQNWKCYMGGRRIRVGEVLRTPLPVATCTGEQPYLTAVVLEKSAQSAVVSFGLEGQDAVSKESMTFGDALELAGRTPLPPYIKREVDAADKAQYQTVYADTGGSVAAPTAGLHMTNSVLEQISARGIDTAEVLLHVGAGTFAQLDEEHIGSHAMHEERISVSRQTLERIKGHVKRGSPIVALGTTSVRTLESLYWYGVQLLCGDRSSARDSLFVSQWEPYERLDANGESGLPTVLESYDALLKRSLKSTTHSGIYGETKLLIVPGYPFKIVDAIVTNFHQPRSTLLMLVSAFLGGPPDELFQVYKHALASDYRFLSYGDSSIYANPEFFSGRSYSTKR